MGGGKKEEAGLCQRPEGGGKVKGPNSSGGGGGRKRGKRTHGVTGPRHEKK